MGIHPAGDKEEAIPLTRFPTETETFPVRPIYVQAARTFWEGDLSLKQPDEMMVGFKKLILRTVLAASDRS
jgi:hypothetical protein